jgi:hypothetical protein
MNNQTRPPPAEKTERISSVEANDADALKSLFRIALETRNFEITQLVQRNNFFMIFQGVLFAGVMQSSHQFRVVSFLVCVAGLVVSIYQVRMACGAKFWQEYWEASLVEAEKNLLEHFSDKPAERNKLYTVFTNTDEHIFESVKKRMRESAEGIIGRLILKRYSVSKTPVYVALGLALVWGLLVISTINSGVFYVPRFIGGF